MQASFYFFTHFSIHCFRIISEGDVSITAIMSLMAVEFDELKQRRRVDELRHQEEEDLAKYLSQKYAIEYGDPMTLTINSDALRVVPEDVARQAKVAPFALIGKKIKVAILSPQNDATVAALNDITNKGLHVTHYLVSPTTIEKIWGRYRDLSFSNETKAGSLDISNDEIVTSIKRVKHIADIKTIIDEILAEKKSYRTTKILEMILAGALAINASDIHLEPEESYVRLRYRLDGVLTDVMNFAPDVYNLLLSRVKLISGLKLNVSGAQDGRFSVVVGDSEIEIRTSVLPGAYNGSIVLRVLNPKGIQVPMEELGIEPRLFAVIEKQIAKPNGMILTTGPTGSGKTTTLYSFLRRIHSPGIKIITIENPIEYHLPGIVQTQTDPDKNYTFAEGLRSALRQDPDVIMVGEIRDNETAEIAVNSALTGHLVFSTLHTNNAAGTFPRLIDLDINPKVITSAINIALAQRLVRKLCPDCRKEIAIDAKNKALMDKVFESLPDKSLVPPEIKLYEAVGCDKCNKTGYKGRIGVHEGILTDDKIEQIITANPSEREIKKAAKTQGILDMRQDGVLKAVRGVTSVSELSRVIDLDEEFI
jgi:type IV pilus assembly protein PilB